MSTDKVVPLERRPEATLGVRHLRRRAQASLSRSENSNMMLSKQPSAHNELTLVWSLFTASHFSS